MQIGPTTFRLFVSFKYLYFPVILSCSTLSISNFSVFKLSQKTSPSDIPPTTSYLGLFIRVTLNGSTPSQTKQLGNFSSIELYLFPIKNLSSIYSKPSYNYPNSNLNNLPLSKLKERFTYFNAHLDDIRELFLHSNSANATSPLFLVDLIKTAPLSDSISPFPEFPKQTEEALLKGLTSTNKFYFSIFTKIFKGTVYNKQFYTKFRTITNPTFRYSPSYRFGFSLEYKNNNNNQLMTAPVKLESLFSSEATILEFSESLNSPSQFLGPLYERLQIIKNSKNDYSFIYDNSTNNRNSENCFIFQNTLSGSGLNYGEKLDRNELKKLEGFLNAGCGSYFKEIKKIEIKSKDGKKHFLGGFRNINVLKSKKDVEKDRDVVTDNSNKKGNYWWVLGLVITVFGVIAVLGIFFALRTWMERRKEEKLIL